MKTSDFSRRRKQLMAKMGKNSIAILPTAPHHLRNRDADYLYRPDSDFYYLTGFAEPEAVAVLMPGKKEHEYVLFCRERDPTAETWHGRRAGTKGAEERYGVNQAFAIDDIDEILPQLMQGHKKIYYTLSESDEFDASVIGWIKQIRQQARAGIEAPTEVIALDQFIHEQRLYKDSAEIKAMKKAGKISAQAHIRAMQACAPGKREFEVEAEILHEFNRHGCVPSYNSIVGGGANGCILHYTENDALLNNNELVLIDAGVEYDFYAGDITRTFPINGKFTLAQRQLYDVVLSAQKAAIKQAKPGKHWNAPHQAAVHALTSGLLELGILKGELKQLIKEEAYRRFYMHRTGHWLGMDVHDVGSYKLNNKWRNLEPGMVFTIEPGLYIPAKSKGVAKKWWDIGIRIEDDILITDKGHEILSKDVPTDPDEIEALMKG